MSDAAARSGRDLGKGAVRRETMADTVGEVTA
jgi:hypothetical protein